MKTKTTLSYASLSLDDTCGMGRYLRPGWRSRFQRQITRRDRQSAKVDVMAQLRDMEEPDTTIPEVFVDLLAIEHFCGEGFALSHLANDNWADPPTPVVQTIEQARVAFARAA